nr:Chain A, TAR DNA-binding protein 43 [Homo sapiens]
GNNSYS